MLDAVEVHQTHVRADHVVPLLLQEAGGDRRIDPARHRDQHRRTHAFEATARRTSGPGVPRIVADDDRGPLRRPDRSLALASGSWRRSACWRPPVPTRSVACSRRPKAPPRAGSGWRATSRTRRPRASIPRSRCGPARTAIRSRGSPWRGSRCSSDARTRPSRSPRPIPNPRSAAAWRPSIDRATYDRAIARIRDHIAAGETYQVNFTLRLRSQVAGDERGLYRDLCYAQRGAYAGYLNLGRYRVLSASPELFFRLDDGVLTTRPMKGTAPRGRWRRGRCGRGRAPPRVGEGPSRERDDRGPAPQRPGTCGRARLGHLERRLRARAVRDRVAAHVDRHRRARPDAGLADVFAALFPSGSVTGAPKVRTMQLIAELEDSPRGVYCGAVGYLAPPGSGHPAARFNVPIRTVIVDAETRTARIRRRRRDHLGLPSRRRVRRDGGQGPRARRPPARVRAVRDDPARAGHGVPPPRPASRAAAGLLRLLRVRDRRAGGRRGRGARGGAVPGPHGAGSGGGRSPRPRDLRCAPLPELLEPVRVALDEAEPIDPADPMVFHKTTRRRRFDEAKARHPDADDVLLTNTRGEVTETTIANVAVKLDGRWWTPPLDAGLLPGVGRELALEEGRMAERPIAVEELRRRRGDRARQRQPRLAPGAAGRLSQSVGCSRRERIRRHRGLVQRTGAQGASGRILVHEHGALAERASSLLHRGRLSGLVRHVVDRARGERSATYIGCCRPCLEPGRRGHRLRGSMNVTRPSRPGGPR